jgi:hypothetical protein
VPKDTLVADVNLDMPILTYPLEDIVVLGGERSSIGPAVCRGCRDRRAQGRARSRARRDVLRPLGSLQLRPVGHPAVSIDTGPGGQGAAAQKLFLDNHYHKPSDQIDLPIDWNSAAKFKHVGYA